MLSLLLAKLAPYAAGLVAIISALAAVIFSAKRSGVKQEQAAEVSKALQQAKDSSAITQEVRTASQSDLDKRLHLDQRD